MGEPDDRSSRQLDDWLFGGMAALCAAVLTQLADRPTELKTFLGAGVFCFALALPLLVCSLLVARLRQSPRTRTQFLADLLGVLAAVAGFAFLFLHVNVWAGGAFVVASVAAGVLFVVTARSPP
jgi:hypothetical protein